ncbi:hypothetical protein T492DRAFT_1095931 [Pavlovales sp. CCMP2436]|nr:hypothetical protein T492DRAFT_1095931 [Pavlovales sp. CCMP2436]|mmetsp:Transcript_25532/g.64878  ORF Transcript_25532/g.64878 Transcript_25532/m.64878 type:complete len:232 (-) Transcript_25532:164-859(-)
MSSSLVALVFSSALAGSARVQLHTPGGMCLSPANGGSVRFVPCVLAIAWELGQDGTVSDHSGACVALNDDSISLAAGCTADDGARALKPGTKWFAWGDGARAGALMSETMMFGRGKCLARDGNGVKVVAKGEMCTPLRAEPLWSFAIKLDGSRAPQFLFSANPHLAAYLCVVFASVGLALVAMCSGGSAQVAPKSNPSTSSTCGAASLPVLTRVYATDSAVTPVRVKLTPQ